MRVVHCKREPYDVYIGRPSKWGNMFSHLSNSVAKYRTDTREAAIEEYERWLRGNDGMLHDLHEVAGKVLGCWCHPQACHGDVIIKLCRERGLIE